MTTEDEQERRGGLDRFAADAASWRAAVPDRAASHHALLIAAAALVEAPADAIEHAARARLEETWRERRFSASYDRPLLLAAALRAEAGRVGPSHPLWPALWGDPPDPSVATRAVLAAVMADAPERLFVDLATRWVQTNETSRAVAWLWPAAMAGCTGGARPLAIADVGCSAGLNLIADRLPPLWTDAVGTPLPLVGQGARTLLRLGLDARPLDVRRAADVAWLRACVWPGEAARLARLDAAIAALQTARAAVDPPAIEMVDVSAVPARLETAAAGLPEGTVFIAYQTLVRDYLPRDLRHRHAAAMRTWVAAAVPSAPRAFVELEAAPLGWEESPATPMALTAHVPARGRDAAEMLVLARCGYHPAALTVDTAAASAFTHALQSRSRS